MTATKIVTPKAAVKDIEKDASMAKQKEMMAAHYDRLTAAPETGAKVCCTFVPGNLNELIMCFDLVNNLPEVNAIQSGLRRLSGGYVLEAEKIGHSEDVCTYVKSDIGMMAKGNIAPNGKKYPDPDVLLLVLHRLLHLHEVVRAAARAVQVRDHHAAHALYGRRQDHAEHDRIHGQAAQGRGDPQA